VSERKPAYGDYRIREGGLGYILEWFDGDKWEWVVDSIHRADCIEEMGRCVRNDTIDRWGSVANSPWGGGE
jgi:hypothetical protein